MCTSHRTYLVTFGESGLLLSPRTERPRNQPSDLSESPSARPRARCNAPVTPVEITARSLQQVEAPFQPIGDSPIRPSPQVADDVPVEQPAEE